MSQSGRPPAADQFISWMSVALLLVLIHFFRSSAAPFLNPLGEPRRSKAFSTSFYFSLTVWVYCWVLSATALTVVPHFSNHYNQVIAAALFFPMLFVTVAALVFGRFVVRIVYYMYLRIKRRSTADVLRRAGGAVLSGSSAANFGVSGKWKGNSSNGHLREYSSAELPTPTGTPDKDELSTLRKSERKNAWMKAEAQTPGGAIPSHAIANADGGDEGVLLVAFHRPFRKLLKSSIFLSASLCLLHAHCWSRDLSAFKVKKSDGAGAVCRVVFSPLSFGGLAKTLFEDSGSGAHASCIWLIWTTTVVALLVTFIQDEFAGMHRRVKSHHGRNNRSFAVTESPSSRSIADDEFFGEEEDDVFFADDEDNVVDARGGGDMLSFGSPPRERPEGTLDMVPWYSFLLVWSVFDILVQLKVFLGRFDARTMQPALQQSTTVFGSKKNEGEEEEPANFDVKKFPTGCVFDCSSHDDNATDGMWFDFVSDCGDGFNSSYQVSRMLAQPQLSVKTGNTLRVLPRGSFLVVGGDLAYPDPTEENFEKRFFRTFEDAMPPPPSFRREAISTTKPALPVRGWKGCFDTNNKNTNPNTKNKEDLLKTYAGPCAFLVPGNHDWFDGLASYNRFILSRDWLGGWLMPQQRSYFALKLAHGWWLLGLDLALSQDIDIDQFKFFADLAAAAMKPSDAVIIVGHEPSWVLNADANISSADELPEGNLRELMDHHLGGRVRARLAGDLHHYTRHVPCASKPDAVKRSRSVPSKLTNRHDRLDGSNNVWEDNMPELIVSGGGGAFLHPTHTFSNSIKVGAKDYMRVCSYPRENLSYRLGWLNIWQFRWRNWRLDLLWAICYFGVTVSLFPLCGIYDDYLHYNPKNHPFPLVLWVMKKILVLFGEIFASGRVSLLVTLVLLISMWLLTDSKLSPLTRLLWGLSHGLVHVTSALGCLLFVESVSEWTVHEGIVKVSASESIKANSGDEGIDLATSIYEEYATHFSHVFDELSPHVSHIFGDFSPDNATGVFVTTHEGNDLASMNGFEQLLARSYETIAHALSWIYNGVPLLKTTLAVFDLPGTIAQKHNDICDILCEGGKECLISKDFFSYQRIDRATMVSYVAAVGLYFVVLAIPVAGNVFGTWLALTLNLFKAQYNEGFSSLRIEHWKNFLKLHLKRNGDLEIFSVGLHRVPKKWVKDPLWEGSRDASRRRGMNGGRYFRDSLPSWKWRKPSKWVPEKNSKRFTPEVVDYTCIPKRSSICRFHSKADNKGFVSAPDLAKKADG